MSQPVKLSDDLVLEARLTGELLERSIAGQIELWARLGREVEALLDGARVIALRRSGKAQPLSTLMASVNQSEGRQRVIDYLEHQPYPHFEPDPDRPEWLIRTDADGVRTRGRFVGRRFTPAGKTVE